MAESSRQAAAEARAANAEIRAANAGLAELKSRAVGLAGDLVTPMVLLARGATVTRAAFEGVKAAIIGRVLGPLGAVSGAALGLLGTIKVLTMAFGRAGVESRAALEKMEKSFQPLMKSASGARARVKELMEFSRNTPFRFESVAEANKTLQYLTKGALATKEGMRLVGDAAAASGNDFNETAFAVGKLYEGIQNGAPIERAAMRLEWMGMISTGTARRLATLQESGASATEVWREMERDLQRNSGGMAVMSQTLDKMRGRLEEAKQTASAAFGQGFMEGEKATVDATTKAVENLTPAFETLGSILGVVPNALGRLKAGFLEFIAAGNWIYLSAALLGENPTSMDPSAASWTATEADTFKGITLAYVYVDDDGGVNVYPYQVGNVFVDNNFNLRSSGSLVGYHAELEPGESETAMDLAFKLIAGADPIFTLFKGNDNGTYNAIKADYIGMMADGAVGPEVALSRTSGRYTSLKPAYVEMQNDAGAKKVVINSDADTEVSLSHTSGKYTSVKAAYFEAKNDAGTRVLTIEVDTEGKIYLLSANPKLQLEGTFDWLEAAASYLQMGQGALGFGEKVILNSDGTLCLQLSPGSGSKLTYSPTTGLFIGINGGAWFQAVGGDLTGKDGDDKEYSLQEITYLDAEGNPKKVKGYFSAPEAAESGLAPRSVMVCVDNVRKSMNVLGSEPT